MPNGTPFFASEPKLKDSIAISSLEERNELTEIQSNYLQQRIAILSNPQMKGGQDE